MMKKFQTLFLLLFLIVGTSTFAQKKISEGTIKMEITKIESEDEAAAGMLQMMKGTETVVVFNKDNSLMSMNMMGGMMTTKVLTKKDSDEVLTLIDAMGNKMMNKSSKADAVKSELGEDGKPNMDITYDKSDTKKILDYNCHKAIIKVPLPGQKDQFMTMTAYVTNDIQLNEDLMRGVDHDMIDGTPLEYTISMNQQGLSFSMTISTVELKTSIADNTVFELDTEGYKEMTAEQMKQMGQGMGF